MCYREGLPPGCPPDDAEEILEPRAMFPLVRTLPPTEDDFRSQRAEKPTRVFKGVTECEARGLSVHADRADSERVLKLPSMRGRRVCRLLLTTGAGRIKQTWTPSHHTWWPLADYDVLACPEGDLP